MLNSKIKFPHSQSKKWLLLILILPISLLASPSPSQIRALYHSLDQKSIEQHLSFYRLYPRTTHGRDALQKAWQLLGGKNRIAEGATTLPHSNLTSLVKLFASGVQNGKDQLNGELVSFIQRLSAHLPNKQLKGAKTTTVEELQTLLPDEIDVARALLLHQTTTLRQIESYEAMIDLMALQILARTPIYAPTIEKIDAINAFLFDQKGFHFPPEDRWTSDIFPYTALPHVIDSKEGVCLGISLLYISIAQRMDLPLHTITPPGHIFVQFEEAGQTINIETTARGIHLPIDVYQDPNTPFLPKRNAKELIGLSLINQASTHWKNHEFEQAGALYSQAALYLERDPLLMQLRGLNAYMAGDTATSFFHLKKLQEEQRNDQIAIDPLITDILEKNLPQEAVKVIAIPTEQTHDAYVMKSEEIEQILKAYPKSTSAPLYLAYTYLQMNRTAEALKALDRFHALYPNHPTAESLLSQISFIRRNFPKAWFHLENAKRLTEAHQYHPKILKELSQVLWNESPGEAS